MKFKLTSLEKKWVLYDVGNSAFTLMVSTIYPIYFNYLAEMQAFRMWITWRTGDMQPQSVLFWWQYWDRPWELWRHKEF